MNRKKEDAAFWRLIDERPDLRKILVKRGKPYFRTKRYLAAMLVSSQNKMMRGTS